MKVYVIEMGEYSDYSVVGVVETKEEAVRLCKSLSSGYEKIVWNEFDTDDFKGLIRYVVQEIEENVWTATYDRYGWYKNYNENSRIYPGQYVIFANSPDEAIEVGKKMEEEYIKGKEKNN